MSGIRSRRTPPAYPEPTMRNKKQEPTTRNAEQKANQQCGTKKPTTRNKKNSHAEQKAKLDFAFCSRSVAGSQNLSFTQQNASVLLFVPRRQDFCSAGPDFLFQVCRGSQKLSFTLQNASVLLFVPLFVPGIQDFCSYASKSLR